RRGAEAPTLRRQVFWPGPGTKVPGFSISRQPGGDLLRQRMAGHQVVRMLPAWQRLDAIEPGGDVLVGRRNIEAELLGRIIQIRAQRQVGDGRLRSENVRAAGEALVDNAERIVDAAF